MCIILCIFEKFIHTYIHTYINTVHTYVNTNGYQDLDGRLSEVQDSTNIDVSLFDNEIAELKAAIDQFDANIGDVCILRNNLHTYHQHKVIH
jgi:hypothetical protein